MPPPHRPMVGILGGSGMGEALGALGKGEKYRVDTPFGPPAAPITVVDVDGVPVALLSRHGEGHRYPPGRVPYRANVFALKSLGVTHLLATAAVGSLREEIRPRDLVVPDQVIDRTVNRETTFFDDVVVHVEFAQPFCTSLRRVLLGRPRPAGGARRRDVRVHGGPAVLDPGGERAAPELGRRPDRDDPPPRGQARPGSRALLRGDRPGHRPRLLAAPARRPRSPGACSEEILGNLGSATEAALGAAAGGDSRGGAAPGDGVQLSGGAHPRGVDRAGAHPRGDPSATGTAPRSGAALHRALTATRVAGPRPGPALRRGPRARCRR